MQFDAGSNLNLTGGAYRSTAATNIFGSVTVNAGADSTIGNDVSTTFGNGSTTALTGNLRLESPLTVVNVGADFAGNGILINRPARTLRLLDAVTSADLAVLIENQGTLQLGDENAAGQVTGVEYQQTATGTWSVDLGGTGLNQFDRLNLTGAMSLAGTLDINLSAALSPSPGMSLIS